MSNLPPGAGSHPFAPWNQPDPPCDLCGLDPACCDCPECVSCGAQGVHLDSETGLCEKCFLDLCMVDFD